MDDEPSETEPRRRDVQSSSVSFATGTFWLAWLLVKPARFAPESPSPIAAIFDVAAHRCPSAEFSDVGIHAGQPRSGYSSGDTRSMCLSVGNEGGGTQ